MVVQIREENLFIKSKTNEKKETLLAIINGVMDDQQFGKIHKLPSGCCRELYYRPSSDGGVCLIEHSPGLLLNLGTDYQRKPIHADIRLTARGMCYSEVERLYAAIKKLNLEWFQL